MISNTGADAIGWLWYYDQTVPGVNSRWQANQARLTQVHAYQTNGQTRYAVVMVDNTGVNARGWWWYVNATVPDLVSHTQTNNARLIDLDIDPATGNFNAVMTSCSSGCPLWWWYVGVPTSSLLGIAAQDGARIIDANSVAGCGDRCWSFVLINNSNAITSRVGEMLRGGTDGTKGLYLKQVGGPVLASLMETTPFEPASTIKATVHLYLMHQLQLGGVQLTDQITQYAPPVGTSCPTNINAGTETFQIADREMMWHSDNTRTRELADHFGTANINSYVNGIGLAQTRINHVIGCGGPPENVTTLSDLALLYENVANQSLVDPVRRSLFFADMAGKAQYTAEGYDWTGLWGTDIPKLIAQEAPADMPASLRTVFQNNMDLAYKAGNYKICPGGNCATYVDHISIFGYAKIPFCDSGGPREFVFGTYIYNSTNDAASSSTFNSTKAELLREQIRAGLAACDHPVYRLYLPAVLRSQ